MQSFGLGVAQAAVWEYLGVSISKNLQFDFIAGR
jgi:hypothetical protein